MWARLGFVGRVVGGCLMTQVGTSNLAAGYVFVRARIAVVPEIN